MILNPTKVCCDALLGSAVPPPPPLRAIISRPRTIRSMSSRCAVSAISHVADIFVSFERRKEVSRQIALHNAAPGGCTFYIARRRRLCVARALPGQAVCVRHTEVGCGVTTGMAWL
jgi:hypothetical protein